MPPRRSGRKGARGRQAPYSQRRSNSARGSSINNDGRADLPSVSHETSTQTENTDRASNQGGGDREQPSRVEIVRLGSDSPASGNDNDNGRSDGKSPFASLFVATENAQVDFDLPTSAYHCADDSMTVHVPKDLIQKVWSGEFVNLSLLLRKGQEQSSASTFSLNERGEIEVKKRPSKAIDNIHDWTDAFLIFISIMIQKFPEMSADLLQYLSLIREAESRSHGSKAWLTYDERFRMRQALYPQSWAKINMDLWLRSMTWQASFQPSSTTTTPKSNHTLQPISSGLCFKFNSAAGCSFRRCKYDHLCSACRGPHRQPDCPRSNFGPSFQKPTSGGHFPQGPIRQGRK